MVDKSIDKREDKYRRISSFIANMEIGDVITPTAISKSVGIHPDTFRDLIDLGDSLKTIGYQTIRDKNGKIKNIMKINENLDIKDQLKEIRKDILDIKQKLEEIKHGKK